VSGPSRHSRELASVESMKKTATSTRVLGVIMLVLFAAGAFFILSYGSNIAGSGPETSQCDQSIERPSTGGPYNEGTSVTAYKTLFPLGIVCSFDAPGDKYGSQQVVHQQWLATALLVISVGGAFLGLLLARPSLPQRSHHSAVG